MYQYKDKIIIKVYNLWYHIPYLIYSSDRWIEYCTIACNHRRYFAIQIRLAETDHWFAQRLSISDFISDSQTWIGNVCKDYIWCSNHFCISIVNLHIRQITCACKDLFWYNLMSQSCEIRDDFSRTPFSMLMRALDTMGIINLHIYFGAIKKTVSTSR